MSKNLGEVINHIMEENSSKQVLIITNHLQIMGTIHDYQNKCKSCHDCIIALKDVKVGRLEEVCNCNKSGCECNVEVFVAYDWFNINTNAIVGFSII